MYPGLAILYILVRWKRARKKETQTLTNLLVIFTNQPQRNFSLILPVKILPAMQVLKRSTLLEPALYFLDASLVLHIDNVVPTCWIHLISYDTLQAEMACTVFSVFCFPPKLMHENSTPCLNKTGAMFTAQHGNTQNFQNNKQVKKHLITCSVLRRQQIL